MIMKVLSTNYHVVQSENGNFASLMRFVTRPMLPWAATSYELKYVLVH